MTSAPMTSVGATDLLSLLDRSNELALAHPTDSRDAERLREPLQLRHHHRGQAVTFRAPLGAVSDLTTRPGAYRAVRS